MIKLYRISVCSKTEKFRRNNTQHNGIQHNDTQHNDTQHNIYIVAILSIIKLNTGHAVECHLCWMSFMLNVIYAECHYAECHYAECHYTECHYTECCGARNQSKFLFEKWKIIGTKKKTFLSLFLIFVPFYNMFLSLKKKKEKGKRHFHVSPNL